MLDCSHICGLSANLSCLIIEPMSIDLYSSKVPQCNYLWDSFVQDLFLIFSSYISRESLYEDDEFSQRELAALVVYKVIINLIPFRWYVFPKKQGCTLYHTKLVPCTGLYLINRAVSGLSFSTWLVWIDFEEKGPGSEYLALETPISSEWCIFRVSFFRG